MGGILAAAAFQASAILQLGRFDPQYRILIAVGQHIDVPVRPLDHVTHALVEVLEQGFAANLAIFGVEHSALQAAGVVSLTGSSAVAPPWPGMPMIS